MLAQVWELDVTKCKSALEAALLENDEIKRLDPPYNIALKARERFLVFYSKDYGQVSETQDEAHAEGPYRPMSPLESVRAWVKSQSAGRIDPVIFYELIDEATIKEGFEIFKAKHGFQNLTTVRNFLAAGASLLKNHPELITNISDSDVGSTYSAEDLAGKFERLFMRAEQDRRQSKALNKLLNAQIHWGKNLEHELQIKNGQLPSAQVPACDPRFPWTALDILTFDRLCILNSELKKHPHRILKGQFST